MQASTCSASYSARSTDEESPDPTAHSMSKLYYMFRGGQHSIAFTFQVQIKMLNSGLFVWLWLCVDEGIFVSRSISRYLTDHGNSRIRVVPSASPATESLRLACILKERTIAGRHHRASSRKVGPSLRMHTLGPASASLQWGRGRV